MRTSRSDTGICTVVSMRIPSCGCPTHAAPSGSFRISALHSGPCRRWRCRLPCLRGSTALIAFRNTVCSAVPRCLGRRMVLRSLRCVPLRILCGCTHRRARCRLSGGRAVSCRLRTSLHISLYDAAFRRLCAVFILGRAAYSGVPAGRGTHRGRRSVPTGMVCPMAAAVRSRNRFSDVLRHAPYSKVR